MNSHQLKNISNDPFSIAKLNGLLSNFAISLLNRLNVKSSGMELLGIIGTGIESSNKQAVITWLLEQDTSLILNGTQDGFSLRCFSIKLIDEIDNHRIFQGEL